MRTIPPLIILFLLCVELNAQSQEILEIRRWYNETQTNKGSYTQLTLDDFEHSSEGGQLVAFKDTKEIRLIESAYYGVIGKSEYEYYFWQDKMIRYIKPDGTLLNPDSQEFIDQERQISEMAKEPLEYFAN